MRRMRQTLTHQSLIAETDLPLQRKETAEIISHPDLPAARVRKFALSSVLRFVSAMVQFWGGYGGHASALIVEGAEEFTDSLTFAAVAVEVRTEKKGISRKARRAAIFLAIGAAGLATFEAISEIIGDGGTWLQQLEGLNLSDPKDIAAIIALSLSTVVFVLNQRGRTSHQVSDRFAYRDSIRDFVIPGMVLALAVFKAPHLAEYAFEVGGVVYGWYNVTQLYKGWRARPKQPS